MIRLGTLELRRLAMPLVTPFRTSFGTETTRDILLVHVTGTDLESGKPVDGWGENVAGIEPRYSYEFVDGVPAFDLLCGSARERVAIEAGAAPGSLFAHLGAEERAFARRRHAYLAYAP